MDLLQPSRADRVPGVDWLTLLPHDRVAALPEPLRVFYRLAAREPLLYGVHSEIFRPPDLEHDQDEGGVVFAVEHQGAWAKVIDPDEADPVVYDDGEPDEEPLSGFLLQFTLVEAAMAAPYQGTAEVTAQQWARLAQQLTPVPLTRPAFVAATAALHVAPGLVVLTYQLTSGQIELLAGTLQRPVLSELCEPGLEWCSFPG